MKPARIARVTALPEAFSHCIQNFIDLENAGFEIDLITTDNDYIKFLKSKFSFGHQKIVIQRNISLFKDLTALWRLIIFFAKNDYDIIHSHSPKAGLLCAIAGFLTRKKVRLHTFTGQRWAEFEGFKRSFFKFLDYIIIKLNTKVYADSISQIDFLIEEGVAKKDEIFCIGNGSFGGVDIQRFNRDANEKEAKEIRTKFNILSSEIVFIFVGRITKDKGVEELVKSFIGISEKYPCKLIFVGGIDTLNNLDPAIVETINNHPQIINAGFQEKPESFLAASDILVLPSYREGFGTVVIEAAASGLCAIGSDIPGLRDAIVDNETGLLVRKKDTASLKRAMLYMLEHSNSRSQMSEKAFQRAINNYSANKISKDLIHEYKQLNN